jgi:hypothetical protein
VSEAITALKTLQERREKKQGGRTAKGEPRGSTTDMYRVILFVSCPEPAQLAIPSQALRGARP